MWGDPELADEINMDEPKRKTEEREGDQDEVESEQINVFQPDREIIEENGTNVIEAEENLNEELEIEEEDNNNLNNALTIDQATTQESENEGADVEDGMTLRRERRVDYASLHKRGVSHMQVKGAK